MDVDPCLLIPNGWNALCFLSQTAGGALWPAWVSYLLRIEP